jgi:hypothetical protein
MSRILPEFVVVDVTSQDEVNAAVDAWIEKNKDHPDVVHANEGFDIMTYLRASAQQCFELASMYAVKYANDEDETKRTASTQVEMCGNCKMNIKVVHRRMSV